MTSSASGLLVIDKAAGPTSHDVVDQVRRIFSTRKVGHAGTLDPPATGVLVLGLGTATRLLSFVQAQPKTYTATVAFGTTTDTLDATGSITATMPCGFTEGQLKDVVRSFVGVIEQVPPMVSAVKVAGKRLHECARAGIEVERRPRTVTVHSLKIDSYDHAQETAKLVVECSSGTYVRTLAADIGDALGCGGHVVELRRTAVGSFTEEDSVTTEQLRTSNDRFTHLLPVEDAVRGLRSVELDDDQTRLVRHGRPLEIAAEEGSAVALFDPVGQLLAVYQGRGDSAKALVVMPS